MKISNLDELYHHGIRGQKWGIRRFQNKDGSLTSAGEKRYADSESTVSKEDYEKYYKERRRAERIKKGKRMAAIALGTIAAASIASVIRQSGSKNNKSVEDKTGKKSCDDFFSKYGEETWSFGTNSSNYGLSTKSSTNTGTVYSLDTSLVLRK